jgi:long-chain fatty acid omega-monooxygenase
MKEPNHPEALLDEQGRLTFYALQSLKYLDAFIMEVLRLHPSAPKLVKFAVADDVLPDKTRVKAGDGVCFCPWIMGRSENLWENPLEFMPERFYNKPKPSPFKYLAFNVSCDVCSFPTFVLLVNLLGFYL